VLILGYRSIPLGCHIDATAILIDLTNFLSCWSAFVTIRTPISFQGKFIFDASSCSIYFSVIFGNSKFLITSRHVIMPIISKRMALVFPNSAKIGAPKGRYALVFCVLLFDLWAYAISQYCFPPDILRRRNYSRESNKFRTKRLLEGEKRTSLIKI
jgi:hypothetical protein